MSKHSLPESNGTVVAKSTKLTGENSENLSKIEVPPPPPCPYKLGEPTKLFNGKFLKATEVEFENPITKEKGIWQIAHRATRLPDSNIDGVTVISILTRESKKYFVIICEYRIPVGQWVLSFPAGLVDAAAESFETCALRELKEETGYTADRVLSTTPGVLPLDPGIASFSGKVCVVHINGDLEINANPKQDLQCGEFIDVMTIPCAELLDTLGAYGRKGYMIEYALYAFAIGQSLQRDIESITM